MMSFKGSQIVTIDGPAGAGKSTVAKRLAKELNLSYLDTGAMYRALTLKAIRQNVDLGSEDALVVLAQKTVIDLQNNVSGVRVLLDGKDVSEDIRSLEVTNKTFHVASAPRVRKIMVEWQRAIGKKSGAVIEGRDVGTVVFPHASHKFYLDADLEERSRRRICELREKGNDVDADKLKAELKTRDTKDLTRSVGPLKKADDAVFIDSTHLSIDEVVREMLKHITAHG
jgi:CMP/dCMP kinase